MAVLRVDGKNLEGNKRLNKSANYLEISCGENFELFIDYELGHQTKFVSFTSERYSIH